MRMLAIRATRKVLRLLPASERDTVASDTALGDWYINRVVIHRRPLLLMVSSRSLLSILAPARDVKTLPLRVADMIGARLRRLPVDHALVDSEVRAAEPVVVGKTLDRSVVGHMVDFAHDLPYLLSPYPWDESIVQFAEERLSSTPCRAGRRSDEVIFPVPETISLLESRWAADGA